MSPQSELVYKKGGLSEAKSAQRFNEHIAIGYFKFVYRNMRLEIHTIYTYRLGWSRGLEKVMVIENV